MKYVMSDLHGCYKEFISMLEMIKFADQDELYILGDIFDRGLQPLDILDYVMSKDNIHLLKGNHEKMYEDFFENGDSQLWKYNGGNSTLFQLSKKNYIYGKKIYNYIRKLPYIKVVDNFILVHAGVMFPQGCKDMTLEEFISYQEEDICLWDRSNIGSDLKFKDYKIICGHTPVQSINNSYENVDIIHTEGHIYIDCGCVFKKSNGRLACLRLDDMEEFYIRIIKE